MVPPSGQATNSPCSCRFSTTRTAPSRPGLGHAYRAARVSKRFPGFCKFHREGVMFDQSVIQALRNIVGEKNVLTHKVDLVTYSFDATADVPRQIPDVVVKPGSTEEIRSIVNL